MRVRNKRWILNLNLGLILAIVWPLASLEPIHNDTNSHKNIEGHRNVFSPRMDYDQWKPLGRGDPLKNDPTYDYVPPVLDRVHYWVDPALRKPDPALPSSDNSKTEILLLGISSKKPSTANSAIAADRRDGSADHFMKFVDGPKFPNSNQRIARPTFQMPSGLSSFFHSQFFGSGNKNRNNFSKGEQRMPYTVLMPPPMVTKKPSDIGLMSLQKVTPRPESSTTTKSSVVVFPTDTFTINTTTPSPESNDVTVQASKLVYQSSSSYNKPWIESTSLKNSDYRDEVVYSTHLQLPDPFITDFNNESKPLLTADSNHKINYVTPPPLMKNDKEIMFKGEVSDDNLDISNTYVKIGKSEAQMHTTGLDLNIPASNLHLMPSNGLSIAPNGISLPSNGLVNGNLASKNQLHNLLSSSSNLLSSSSNLLSASSNLISSTSNLISSSSSNLVPSSPIILPSSKVGPLSSNMEVVRGPNMQSLSNNIHSGTQVIRPHNTFANSDRKPNIKVPNLSKFPSMQNLESMQTMQPPSINATNSNPNILRTTNLVLTLLDNEKQKSTTLPTISEQIATILTTTTPATTTTTALTTDPLFKHYKQPAEPLKGPLYLIIQGHSKVKTYGPSKIGSKNPLAKINEISDDSGHIDYNIKHLHGFLKETNKPEDQMLLRKGKSGDLQTLKHVAQTGYGAIEDESDLNDNRRHYQEADLQVGYEVSDGADITTERYHKGIVEEARKLKL